MTHAERMRRFLESDLYVVITTEFCAGRPALEILEQCLAAGVSLIQLREKHMETRPLYELACAFRKKTREASALLIVDDRLDIALAVDADGVHLGQQDLPHEVARRLAPEMIIGASTHSLEQALAAQAAGASYVNIGPIFPTRTKEKTAAPLTPEAVRRIAPHLRIPFTCMGGITRDNIGELLDAGARHIAVVTAVTAAESPELAARDLRERILHARRSR